MNEKTNFELKRELIFRIFQKYKDDNIQIGKLAKIINLSTKHTRRLWKEFKQNKSVPLFHNLKNKQSIRKKDCTNFISEYKAITKKNNDFKKDNSYRISFTDFYDNNKDLKSFCSLRTINTKMKEALIYSPCSYQKTKREINKKIKVLKNRTIKKEVKEINQYQLFKESKPYLKKLNLEFGEIVELDACQHRWINNEKFYVYHAVESKTGMILAIHVEKEETTLAYYLLLEKMLKKYGAPTIIKTDKTKTFWGSELTQTLMQQSLNTLMIELICDSSPTFKPNVERSFYTSQIFYPKLAFLKNINTLEDFQKNIDDFATSYNLKFNKKNYLKN